MDENDTQGTAQPTIDPQARGEQPFTIFTIWERRWIVFLSAFAGMFSPMSSFIFYPAITAISNGLGVTIGLVNLAITTYMVVSGIAPALLGNAADILGRRPIYILALAIYLVANIGLALQNSFPALLVLRMLQSAGSSGGFLWLNSQREFSQTCLLMQERDHIARLRRFKRYYNSS